MKLSDKAPLLNGNFRRTLGMLFTFAGLFLFVLGADPGFFGLDRSAVIGFVQVSTFSLGLIVTCLGGSLCLASLWPKTEMSIVAEIGLRLAWTGLVISMASGMADVFGLGTRPLSESITFFGYWQARGVLIGEIVIIIGFLMMIPYRIPENSQPERRS